VQPIPRTGRASLRRLKGNKLCDLNNEERQLLCDVIDCHLEGIHAGRDHVIEDRTIESPEVLLDLTASFDQDERVLRSAKEKLC
jgi:hypothetical protein